MSTANKQNRIHGDILVVDDDTTNLKFLEAILTERGYQVRAASDGELALQSVNVKLPELILLDYKMPGMDGIEVCSHLKGNPETKNIPVIFLSGLEETELKVKALEAGAIDYVTKPIDSSELLVRIQNHLNLFRLQKELECKAEELRKEIEERKLAEENLEQSLGREQILADIFRDAPIAIAYGYEDGRLGNCNVAFSELTGYSLEELQDINWSKVLTPPKWIEGEIAALQKLSPADNFVRYEKEYIRKNGEVFPVELVVCAKFDTEQNLINYVGFVTDISHRKKMEEQIILNEKLATIAGLAAGVAHEINTPLSAILQANQLVTMALSLENPSNKENAAEFNVDLGAVQAYFEKNQLNFFMDGIRESALKAGNIIKSLLEFSRPHEGTFASANLEEIMESSLLLSQADYEMKKKYAISDIQFVKKYQSNLPLLNCVATEIEQVILNLIKNSVQAMFETDMTEKGCVTLGIALRNKSVILEVEDNGPGIKEDVKKHIFDPFFTTRDVGIGTGLGLSVSYTIIVDKHKGSISVESELGHGTKFIVELPMD